jgi:hypothetical protein
MHIIFLKFKIKWKEYSKMMPLGERLDPASKRYFPSSFTLQTLF